MSNINLMQIFALNRLVPSIWLKRQCLEGHFHGKVKNNALSIKNGRATPKRYSPLFSAVCRRFASTPRFRSPCRRSLWRLGQQSFYFGRLSPYTYFQLFGFPMHLLLKPLLIYPYHKTTFAFFGYLFVYLNLVSVFFTHRNITFCLPPFVIFHFYVTRVQQNMFQFTSLVPRSVFVYLALFLVPHNIFLFT